MLSQVSKALSSLFRPLASSKSDADRDPAGSTFERYTDKKKDQNQQQSDHPSQTAKSENPASEDSVDLSSPPVPGNVILFPHPEAQREAQKKAIGISQAWLGLKDLVKGSGARQPSTYEQSSSQASSSQLSKKGAILDKKAG